MACKIGLTIYVILQFIAFVFILVGTPIDMFRSKAQDAFGNTPCLTMWGYKQKCYSTKYDQKIDDLFATCPGRRDRFRAAEAFAIICIFVYGAAFLLGLIMFCCCACFRWLCLVLNIVGLSSIVTWAIMVNTYVSNVPGNRVILVGTCRAFKDLNYKYGAGFALFVVAWCLNLINIVFILLPC